MNTYSDKKRAANSDAVQSNLPVQSKIMKQPVQLRDNRPQSVIQKKLVDRMANAKSEMNPIQKKENDTGLPGNLKSGIENLSGHSIDDVKVHYNSAQPAQLNAHAYAQGTDIHIAPGQEKHLPHEAWHVVQQKQGKVKPTMQMKGRVNVNDDKGLEREADIMGGRATQFKAPAEVSYKNPGVLSAAMPGSKIFQRVVTPGLKKNTRVIIIKTGAPGVIESEMEKERSYMVNTFFAGSLRGVQYKYDELNPAGEDQEAVVTDVEKPVLHSGLQDSGWREKEAGEQTSLALLRSAPKNRSLPSGENLHTRGLGPFSVLNTGLLRDILRLSAGVEIIFGKPVAHNPAVLAKLMRVNKSFYALIKNNPKTVGYYLQAVNAINKLALERRPSKSVFGGKYQQIMKPNEMVGLMESAKSIQKLFPPERCAYISLGNSPVPLMTYLKMHGATVLPLPLSGVSKDGIKMWRDSINRARMMAYLHHFVSPEMLQHKLPVVIDVTASGESLRVARFMLAEYYKANGYNIDVMMLALNNKDQEKEALSPEIGKEMVKGLPGEKGPQYDFLQQILEKFYKEGIKYLLWNRTEMDYIFAGGGIGPEVQEALYQRMVIELARIEKVLKDREDYI